MSDEVEQVTRADAGAETGAEAAGKPSADPNRRGPGEWVVIALLIVLIAFVAWKQFGSLFSDPEPAPGGPQHLQMGSGGEAEAAPELDDPNSNSGGGTHE